IYILVKRETKLIVEKMSDDKSRKILAEADLVIFMLNNNETLTEDDRTIFKTLENMNYIVLVNKVDLDNKLDIEEVNELTQGHAVITTSIVNDEGIDQLEKALSD